MKRESRHARLATIFVATAAVAVTVGCAHSPRRRDWQNPSALPCTSDADCRGGTCGIEAGNAQGVCAGPALAPRPGDGGAAPLIEPSASDVHL